MNTKPQPKTTLLARPSSACPGRTRVWRFSGILAAILALVPGTVLAFEESLETTFEGSSETSTQSQKIQVARIVKRDAERYLAGSSMSRELVLALERFQADHPECDTDETVGRVLKQADRTLAEAAEDPTREPNDR